MCFGWSSTAFLATLTQTQRALVRWTFGFHISICFLVIYNFAAQPISRTVEEFTTAGVVKRRMKQASALALLSALVLDAIQRRVAAGFKLERNHLSVEGPLRRARSAIGPIRWLPRDSLLVKGSIFRICSSVPSSQYFRQRAHH